MIYFTQGNSADSAPKKSRHHRIVILLWLSLVVISIFACVIGFCCPSKYTETTDIADYGVYSGTNDDAFTRNFISSFFPKEITPSINVVKYSYRAENVDTYGFEAYLEIHIDNPDTFEDYIQSIAPTEKWGQFTFSEKYFEYSIENVLDISIRNPDDWAQQPYHPIECARIRKVLCCAESQTIIFVAIGVYDGGGVGTDYLCAFFDRFEIDPIAYEETADSPYVTNSP